MAPDVSVIIPVYNRSALIGRAIASLTAQTLPNIEIIVVDDGSTDGTAAAAEQINDSRVRLLRHSENRGIPAARNTGLAEARGRYIAWLDSDDVARPERLEVQHAFLEANPSIALIGAAARRIAGRGIRKLRISRPPATHEEIVAKLLFRSAFQQSSVMGRAEILRKYPYRPQFDVCEDVDMFNRLTREYRTANLPDVLIDRHLHAGQTIRRESVRIVEKKKVLLDELLQRLGIAATEDDLDKHVLLANIKRTKADRAFFDWAERWLARIAEANSRAGLYDPAALAAASGRVWRRALRNAPLGYRAERYARRLMSSGRVSGAAMAANSTGSASLPWAFHTAAAVLLICAGWVGRGQFDAPAGSLSELAREADGARDVFAASYPAARGASLGHYESLAQRNGLSAIVMPKGWRIVSSAVAPTQLGRTLELSAIAPDGTPLTMLIARNARSTEDAPVITVGDDERIASWSKGGSDYALAAQASAGVMSQLVLELYDSKTLR